MREAAKLGSQVMAEVLALIRPGVAEFDLAAEFSPAPQLGPVFGLLFVLKGAAQLAFSPDNRFYDYLNTPLRIVGRGAQDIREETDPRRGAIVVLAERIERFGFGGKRNVGVVPSAVRCWNTARQIAAELLFRARICAPDSVGA